MGGNSKISQPSPTQMAMFAANPVLFANSSALNKGLELQRQPELERKRRLLEAQARPEAESQALQARQQSIAGGTVGGAGFAQETAAYNEIMRRLAQAMRAYEERLQGQQMQALGTAGRVAGAVIGAPAGPSGVMAGSQIGGLVPGAFSGYSGGYRGY